MTTILVHSTSRHLGDRAAFLLRHHGWQVGGPVWRHVKTREQAGAAVDDAVGRRKLDAYVYVPDVESEHFEILGHSAEELRHRIEVLLGQQFLVAQAAATRMASHREGVIVLGSPFDSTATHARGMAAVIDSAVGSLRRAMAVDLGRRGTRVVSIDGPARTLLAPESPTGTEWAATVTHLAAPASTYITGSGVFLRPSRAA